MSSWSVTNPVLARRRSKTIALYSSIVQRFTQAQSPRRGFGGLCSHQISRPGKAKGWRRRWTIPRGTIVMSLRFEAARSREDIRSFRAHEVRRESWAPRTLPLLWIITIFHQLLCCSPKDDLDLKHPVDFTYLASCTQELLGTSCLHDSFESLQSILFYKINWEMHRMNVN